MSLGELHLRDRTDDEKRRGRERDQAAAQEHAKVLAATDSLVAGIDELLAS